MENDLPYSRWKARWIGLLALLWLAVLPLYMPAHQNGLEFQRYSIEEGLSQNSVFAILKDSRGLMWFGTNDGLNQFDGYEFTQYNYNPGDSRSISDNAISSLVQQGARYIWVGTHRGLNVFDIYTNTFTRYFYRPDTPGSLSHNTVKCLFLDSGGTLWIGTNNGVNKFDAATGTFTHYFKEEEAPGAPDDIRFGSISAIGETLEGNILVGSRSQLITLNPKSGTYSYFSFTNPNTRVTSILRDSLDRIWVTVNKKHIMLLYRGPEDLVPVRSLYPFLNEIHDIIATSIAQDAQHRFWIGTPGNGLLIIDLGNNKAFWNQYIKDTPHSLSDNHISRIYSEKNGMWIGTSGRGISFWNPYQRKFDLINSSSRPVWLSSRSIRAIYQDREGILWVSGYQAFDRVDRKNGITSSYYTSLEPDGLSSHYIMTICPDPEQPDRILWLGTETAGINKFDKQTGLSRRYMTILTGTGKARGNQVNKIIADQSGVLWVGTEQGLHRYDRAADNFVYIPLAEGEAFVDIPTHVRTIHDTEDGYLWLGTQSKGLIRFEKKTGTYRSFTHQPNDPSSISANNINTIVSNADHDILWIGTSGGGLNRYQRSNSTFQHYMTKHGLPNNTIYGILEDRGGRLWLSTNNGLSRFDPQTESFRNFSMRDGLQSREFNRTSYFKSDQGEMFFGGINGLNSFFPEHLHDNPQIPPVAITDFQILNQSVKREQEKYPGVWQDILTKQSIQLAYDDNLFSIEFASLNFIGTIRNLYRYKMEGLEHNWIDSGARRFVTYAKLPPGNYTFRVTSSHDDQTGRQGEMSLGIHIAPPYWLTLWFRALIIVSVLIALMLFYMIRTANIRRRNTELNKINTRLNKEILERQQAEAKIQTLLRSIEQSPSPVAITNKHGNIEYANSALLKSSGISARELHGEPMRVILSPRFTSRELARIWLHVKSGKQWRGEMPARSKDGSTSWENVVISPILDEHGEIANVLVLKEDITSIKSLQQQVLQTQKMESIGNLAGGIAHDFNNIITIISGHAEMSLHKLSKNQSPDKSIDAIINAAKRAENLTRQLLAFSRKQIYDPIVLDVNKVIKGLDKMLGHLISEEIRFKLELDDSITPIKADPNQLEQLLINLIINARDAIEEKHDHAADKQILIETKLVNLNATFINKHFDANPGYHVLIAVSDNGTGMTEEQKAMIFEPFYSTKDQGKGTGLGLATVYGIVKQNRGSIYVYSEPGHGSTFKIYWPASSEHVEDISEQPESQRSLQGHESILLVEDDMDVLQFTSAALREFGYDIHKADCGKCAIQMVKNNNIHYDLLVTDVVMPEMNGQELSQRIQELQPDIRVLYTSGYTQNNSLTQNGAIKEGVQFIQKPYSIYGLTKKIRQIIDAPEN